MSVGERATLTCSSDCAYGERGHPGVYPLNSNLKIVIIIKTYTGCLKKNATEIKQAVVHHKRG